MVKLLGAIVFVATSFASCATVRYVSSEVLNPVQTQFAGGVPPATFVVAFHSREAGKDEEAYAAAPWRHAQTLMAKDPGQFRLPVKEFRSKHGDPFAFKVLEETANAQVVELTRADYGTVRTRYRVEGNRITPLAYKSDGGVGRMVYELPMYLLCLVVGFLAAKRSVLWTRRKAAPVEKIL